MPDFKKLAHDALSSGVLPAVLRVLADTVERDPAAIVSAIEGNFAPLATDVAKAAPELIGAAVKVILASKGN